MVLLDQLHVGLVGEGPGARLRQAERVPRQRVLVEVAKPPPEASRRAHRELRHRQARPRPPGLDRRSGLQHHDVAVGDGARSVGLHELARGRRGRARSDGGQDEERPSQAAGAKDISQLADIQQLDRELDYLATLGLTEGGLTGADAEDNRSTPGRCDTDLSSASHVRPLSWSARPVGILRPRGRCAGESDRWESVPRKPGASSDSKGIVGFGHARIPSRAGATPVLRWCQRPESGVKISKDGHNPWPGSCSLLQ
jgi:hypothetical protein